MATNIAMQQLQRKLVIGMIYDFVKEMSPKILKSGVAVGFIAGFAPMFWYHKNDKKRTQEEANQKTYESVADELKFIKSVADELKLIAEKPEMLKLGNNGNNEPSNNRSPHSPELPKDSNNNSSSSSEPSKSSSNTSNNMSLDSEPLRNYSNSNPAYPEPLKNNSSSSSSYPEPSNNSNSPSILYKWIFG